VKNDLSRVEKYHNPLVAEGESLQCEKLPIKSGDISQSTGSKILLLLPVDCDISPLLIGNFSHCKASPSATSGLWYFSTLDRKFFTL
jgi:hypothetical protein